jgi:DNA-binding MarR family transcriptional regulator
MSAVRAAPAVVTDEEWEVWRAFTRMRLQLDRALADRLEANAGISAPDYVVLLVLFEAEDRRMRAARIAELIAWEKSRLSHQLTRMEQRGLVRREDCDDDLRGKWVVLTNDGRRAVLKAMRDHNRAIREYFFDVISDEERAMLHRLSARVVGAVNPGVYSDEPEPDPQLR